MRLSLARRVTILQKLASGKKKREKKGFLLFFFPLCRGECVVGRFAAKERRAEDVVFGVGGKMVNVLPNVRAGC